MATIQIRNVPEDVHRKLSARAAGSGQTLSDYVFEIVRRESEQPTLAEIAARIQSRTPVELQPSSAEIIRELREGMG